MNLSLKNKISIFKIYGFWKTVGFAASEIYRYIWLEKINKSFSQKGEDLLMDRILGRRKKGFYVDVGAYHPTRFNNTKRFYLRGWRGINIEPDPKNVKRFKEERKRDINLNIGIGIKESQMIFYEIYPPTLSTFSFKRAKSYQSEGYKLVSTKSVEVNRLDNILSKYVKTAIDFISVDTEGFEISVLTSNDWKRFRPRLVCIESFEPGCKKGKNIWNGEVRIYLEKMGYELYRDNGLNSIYVDREFLGS